MSRVLPILFNTEMVRAILDGRKTVTRRVMKKTQCNGLYKIEPDDWDKGSLNEPWCNMPDSEFIKCTYNPPYQPGDILYVRETWCWEPCWDCGMDTEEHNCCDESANKFFNHDKGEWGCYVYKASLEDNVYPSVGTWHPSIHMPKEAARIWLKVTDVRVERLQDITEAGILAEGVDNGKSKRWENMQRIAFENLWNSTIKKSDLDRYGWDANPWVWVIEFERCEKPKDWR